MVKKYDVVIIGGGAAAMTAAIRCDADVLIIEKNEILGKKILATGNGRCNISNKKCKYESEFANELLSIFGVEETLKLFQNMGIEYAEENDRIYPASYEAKSVREILERNVLMKTDVIKDTVRNVRKKGEIFFVETSDKIIESRAVIIATGGKAAPQYGLTGEGFRILKNLGHNIKKPIPALVPLTSDSDKLPGLAGVRVNGEVSLYVNGEFLIKESGQIQFTKNSISGICTFDVSRYVRDIYDNKYTVKIDFFQRLSNDDTLAYLKQRSRNIPFDYDFLTGVLPEKLGKIIMGDLGVNLDGGDFEPDEVIKKLVKRMKEMEFNITGTKGWKEAQVTDGGVEVGEINADTLESKLVEGLFMAGEVIDVTGRCGGYNLQWAFTSGAVAGKSAERYVKSK